MTVKFREDTGKWQAVLNNKELFGNKRPAKSFRVRERRREVGTGSNP